MEWLLITADPEIARYAEASGVHRVFVDMEVNGKQARQGHVDTHMAAHTFDDISAVREVISTAELLVRVNPLHDGTRAEVAEAVARGADRIMLPMFTGRSDVEEFRSIVPSSTPITLLVETPPALVQAEEWTPVLHPGDDVHFGLNDLSLAMGLRFLFEPLAANLLQGAADHLLEAGIPCGIARPNGGMLPAKVVMGEHVRLGSSRVILSRAFHGSARSLAEFTAHLDLASELSQLRQQEDDWRAASPDELAENHRTLAARTFEISRALTARDAGAEKDPPSVFRREAPPVLTTREERAGVTKVEPEYATAEPEAAPVVSITRILSARDEGAGVPEAADA